VPLLAGRSVVEGAGHEWPAAHRRAGGARCHPMLYWPEEGGDWAGMRAILMVSGGLLLSTRSFPCQHSRYGSSGTHADAAPAR
jgi:hypothetical protein